MESPPLLTKKSEDELDWMTSSDFTTTHEKVKQLKSNRGIFGRRGNTMSRTRRLLPQRRDALDEQSGPILEEIPALPTFPNKPTRSLQSFESENIVNHSRHRHFASMANFPSDKSRKPALRLARSMSLNLSTSSDRSSSFSRKSSSGEFYVGSSFGDSLTQNDLSLVEEEGIVKGNTPMGSDSQRGRKKIRARRASIQGMLPVSTPLSQSAVEADKTAWKKSATKDSPDHAVDDFEFKYSSPEKSVSSSRKRGSSDSPTSDRSSIGYMSINSSSSLSKGQQRSRSRIFSPDPSGYLPLAPTLTPNFEQPIKKKAPPRRGRRGIAIESDDDEDESMASNTSIHSIEEDHHHHSSFPNIQTTEKQPNSDLMQDTPLDDLKFLYTELRREGGSKRTMAGFGTVNSWSVTPPVSWNSERRVAFMIWAGRLGFARRSVGASMTYLQIQKSKGQMLLERVRSVLKARLQQEHAEQRIETAVGRPVLKSAQQGSNTMKHSKFGSDSDPFTSALADELQMLTMKETSMVRTVTLDPQGQDSRLSRPSFDHHTHADDLVFHLQGYSPQCDGKLKPMRTSVSSVVRNDGRVSTGAYSHNLPPILSQELLETPCMNQETGWGSCPVIGRDWGGSDKCEVYILSQLQDQFEEASRTADANAGTQDSFGNYIMSESLPMMPLGHEIELSATAAENNMSIQGDANDFPIEPEEEKRYRRRQKSYAKHKRMSLFNAAVRPVSLLPDRKPLFQDNLGRLSPIKKTLACLEEFPSRFSKALAIREGSAEVSEPVPLDGDLLADVFSYLNESEILSKAFLVSTEWSEAAARAHAAMMLASVSGIIMDEPDEDEEDEYVAVHQPNSVAASMERSWEYLHSRFPWGSFLAEGAFKQVFRVYNCALHAEEAISVMDIEAIVDKKTIGTELAVSALLSSLVRRGICPNFVATRGSFTCPYAPPKSHWGTADNKRPLGNRRSSVYCCPPRRPSLAYPGRFQYIRMELCDKGDAEEFMKTQPEQSLQPTIAQSILFQAAFGLHAAADRFSVKHYDLKLLNIFLQTFNIESPEVVLRYGLGSHVFAIRMPKEHAILAKLADYGTANIKAESNGQPVTIAQFTTLENTPPDFMILGDNAKQGHEHDSFALGLSMLHLFTGHAPYEEIMEEAKCPINLKKKLRKIWENDKVSGYDVLRSIILAEVYQDEAGNIIDGEPDDTLYDTLYRYIVLFGIPEKFQEKKCSRIWSAIYDSLQASCPNGGRPVRKRQGTDIAQYSRDCKKFAIRYGNNQYIARARESLEAIDGGLDLLFHLCSFNPEKRASAMDVLNSHFMSNLREQDGVCYSERETVFSYTAFSTNC